MNRNRLKPRGFDGWPKVNISWPILNWTWPIECLMKRFGRENILPERLVQKLIRRILSCLFIIENSTTFIRYYVSTLYKVHRHSTFDYYIVHIHNLICPQGVPPWFLNSLKVGHSKQKKPNRMSKHRLSSSVLIVHSSNQSSNWMKSNLVCLWRRPSPRTRMINKEINVLHDYLYTWSQESRG